MTNPAVPNRDRQHGGLEAVGIVSQRIKSSMRDSSNWESLALHPAGKEALDMIAHKIARVLSGSDPHDFQHWEDIAGYATAFMRTWSELMYEGDGDDEDEDEEGADAIEDETTKESKIILDTCKIGQKLKLRNGKIVNYEGANGDCGYPHQVGSYLYTNKGKYYGDDEDDDWDVVEILPLEDEEEKGCPDGFCPMPNVRQGPAIIMYDSVNDHRLPCMFDPAD